MLKLEKWAIEQILGLVQNAKDLSSKARIEKDIIEETKIFIQADHEYQGAIEGLRAILEDHDDD